MRSLRPFVLIALCVCASLTAWAATRGPDAGGYLATDSAVFSFLDIAGGSGGASLLAGTDDGTALLTMPFAFQFYGHPYTLACVSTNGALYFVPDNAACTALASVDFANVDIATAQTPDDRPAILPLWSDLSFQVPGAGAVFYQTLGAVGSRKFVVQWNNAYPQGSTNPVTFQLILSEGTGGILFQYKSVGLGHGNPATNGGQATVGSRNSGGQASGQQLPWSYAVPVIADNSALSFGGADTTGPVITSSANPSSLWPANNKTVNVVVTGTIVDANPGVNPSTPHYAVTDEYGQVQPSGNITLGSGGSYSFSVGLMASRLGNDQDGRKYTITISAADRNGNASSKAITVTVPHDQGK